ncbi:MAG TPA: ABC transporter ATP-binding protein [Candidatus Enterosoma merdigallinarum]|nr:ABC transporter ATP-binding protein [Candidatus Enterosoma merdigallinarum]
MLFGKYVNPYYRKYWYYFLFVFLSDAIVDIAQLFVPILIGNIITKLEMGDFVVTSEDGLWYHSDLTVNLLLIAGITLIIVVGRIGWRYFSAHIGGNIERDLREKMFEHIQTLSLSYYKDKKVGGLLSYFTNDLMTIKTLFNECIIWVTDLIVLGVLAFTLMFLMSWQITLFTTIPLFAFIVFGYSVGKNETRRFKEANDAFEDMSDFTEENLQGFSVIKAFRKEKAKRESFKRLADDARTKSVSYQRYSSLIDSGINFFLTCTFSIMMGLGTYAIISQNPAIAGKITDVGKLSTYIGFYNSLSWPMIAGGLLIDYISRGRGAYKRISEIFESKPDVVDSPDAVSNDHVVGEVAYSCLTFSYPDSPEGKVDLENITFHVRAGEMVGIIGRTGSGKSTLLSLLDRLYNVPEETVFIDGIDINLWPKKVLREQIGLVGQEAFLFSGPLWKTVSFSETDPDFCDRKKVEEACAFACIDADILSQFKDGYDTIIGEKGSTVSGGQRQRLSIARAIYKNPPILILDDSLSAVDADTEKKILANIRDYRRGKTTFVIAHRISAVEEADDILVMDGGRIVGEGKHHFLLESCPLYRDIYRLQELEKEVSA